MEMFNEFLTTVENSEALIAAVIGLYCFIRKVYLQAKLAKKEEKFWVIVNALKDENKMVDGEKFTNDFISKLEKIGKALNVSNNSLKEAKANILQANTGSIKVGSYKGKPIYANNILKEAGRLKSLARLFKGIF